MLPSEEAFRDAELWINSFSAYSKEGIVFCAKPKGDDELFRRDVARLKQSGWKTWDLVESRRLEPMPDPDEECLQSTKQPWKYFVDAKGFNFTIQNGNVHLEGVDKRKPSKCSIRYDPSKNFHATVHCKKVGYR